MSWHNYLTSQIVNSDVRLMVDTGRQLEDRPKVLRPEVYISGPLYLSTA